MSQVITIQPKDIKPKVKPVKDVKIGGMKRNSDTINKYLFPKANSIPNPNKFKSK